MKLQKEQSRNSSMGRIFKLKNEYSGKIWEFELGKTYYIVDRVAYTNSSGNHWIPSVEKAECVLGSKDDDEEFYLKHIEHEFWSPLPLGGYDHPSQYSPDDWDGVFASSLEEVNNAFLKRFASDDEIKAIFFHELFDGVE